MPANRQPEHSPARPDHATLADHLLGLVRPYPGNDPMAVRVTTAVNSVSNDGPECLDPAA